MLTFLAKLRPKAATLTPWQADTIFGHLCWTMRHNAGESELVSFLEHYRQNDPPVLLSNGFPAGLLPRPYLPPQKIEHYQFVLLSQ